MWLHPMLGEAMVITDLAVPTFVGLILLVAILRGSPDTCERAFRLLRWIVNRPEPQEPRGATRERGNRLSTTPGSTRSAHTVGPDKGSNVPLAKSLHL